MKILKIMKEKPLILKKLFIIILLISAISLTGLTLFLNNTLNKKIQEDKYILVEKGDSLNKIISKISNITNIQNKLFLKLTILYKTGFESNIRYGEYFFEKNSTINEIIKKLIDNKIFYRTITIAEGLSTNSIIEILKNNEFLTGEIPNNIPEGSLLPETYTYQKGDTRQSIIKRMQKAMGETFNKYWSERDNNLPFKTKKEALTLASIVEKETGLSSERPLVASVFINRLKINMKLQSDPTAIYGYAFGDTKKEKEIKTNILIKQDSPYNTYKIKRLPPTPICNPGKEAIKAVLNPPKTKYLFFVATGKGGHNFSENYVEHKINVRNYKKIKDSIK